MKDSPSRDKSIKLTARLDPALDKKVDKIIEERKKIDPNFDKSKLVRELLMNYDIPNMSSLVEQVIKYAITYGISSNELRTTIGTFYKIYERELQKQPKDPK